MRLEYVILLGNRIFRLFSSCSLWFVENDCPESDTVEDVRDIEGTPGSDAVEDVRDIEVIDGFLGSPCSSIHIIPGGRGGFVSIFTLALLSTLPIL